ncbi:hypothetical protein [Salidesulfovibrio brasiliensis]|uniref:hypothetical protein n=1 Tax=Salidesulfovibrio brasiliensis TaxID=221711 RepID=UPI0006D163C2|nr:hypothetical protein [Salidesulfovibrio brasiliensis]
MRTLLVSLTIILSLLGCRHPLEKVDLHPGPEYAGEWLTQPDVLRIAGALTAMPDRTPAHWDNTDTGYQYSMTVFKTANGNKETVREFTVLSTAPDGTAEVLNLRGASSARGEWNITADTPSKVVGKACRLNVDASETPKGTVGSGEGFPGFMVVESE